MYRLQRDQLTRQSSSSSRSSSSTFEDGSTTSSQPTVRQTVQPSSTDVQLTSVKQ